MFRQSKISVTPLGGVNYVGHNCFLYESNNSAVAVDCGIKPRAYGDESWVSDPNWIEPPPRLDILDDAAKKGKKIIGVVTHAHLDHIGAIGELAKRQIPIYLSRWSKLFLQRYAENLKIPENADFRIFDSSLTLEHDDFDISFAPLPHSIPGNYAVLIKLGKKNILHLGDFKFNAVQESLEETRRAFQEIRRKAGRINCLVLDVLNAEMEGFTPPEQRVLDSVEKIVKEARGRVIITFFSSNLKRMEGILKIAQSLHRTVGVAGWGMNSSYNMLSKRWSVKYGSILLIGGSQGEENSNLTKMAFGEHKYLQFSRRDTLVGSFRSIPGNEEGIKMTLENIRRTGARIILHEGETAKLNLSFKPQEMFLHVSGHEQRNGLLEVVNILDPKIIVPFHAPQDRFDIFENFVGAKRIHRLQAGETIKI